MTDKELVEKIKNSYKGFNENYIYLICRTCHHSVIHPDAHTDNVEIVDYCPCCNPSVVWSHDDNGMLKIVNALI